jgi:delta 1-pyrroline-5-carboxylate dehydrogenase
MDYRLEGAEGVNGVIYKINLKGYGMTGGIRTMMEQC